MGQIQCPNDGGFRVQRLRSYRVDPRTGKAEDPAGCLAGFLFLLPWGFVVGALVLGERVVEDFGHKPELVFPIAGSVLLAGTIISVTIALYRTVGRGLIRAGDYRCEICGYEFYLRDDTPRPPATIRPDLLLKGYRRLVEEEEERRRQLYD